MPNNEKELGKLIFNGTILFLSISFGLFTLSLGGSNTTITSIFTFGIFTILVLISGIASLILSFLGIKNNHINCIIWGGVCFLIMIVLLTFAYSQIYISTISESAVINPI